MVCSLSFLSSGDAPLMMARLHFVVTLLGKMVTMRYHQVSKAIPRK
jgi:hypothetical protein